MEFAEVVTRRRSVRGYLAKDVPAEVLDRVLDSIRVSPSACNLQPRSFIVVRDAATRQGLREAYDKEWLCQAPVVLAACADPGTAWKRGDGFNAALVDLAIAFDHMTLAAANEGLGTCWVCNFDEAKAKAILGVPSNIQLVALSPLGYPDPAAPLRPFVRKTKEEIFRQDKW
jgi:nitroreductase